MPNKQSAELVSIIIPCYNHGQFLNDALESALLQTHQGIEVVVVNDGSTDPATNEVISQLAAEYKSDKRVKFISQDNKGLSGARNAGIAASAGEFIVPLDADDKIAPEFVAKTQQTMAAAGSDKVGVVSTNAKLFGDYEQDWRLQHFSAERELAIHKILATCLIRRQTYEAVKGLNGQGYNESLRKGYEDWDFWLSVIEAGWEFAHLPEFLFFYRKHGTTMVEKVKKDHAQNFQKVISLHKNLYATHYPEVITTLQEELNHAHAKIAELEGQQNRKFWLLKRMVKRVAGK
jgi:glycosyltransferase involved in cell wall biosynthesis